MKERKKYFYRYAAVFMFFLPILAVGGKEAFKVLIYKLSMCGIALGISEAVWATFFKPYYGRTEEIDVERQRNILIFRAILYAAIILAFTLGL